ncbi:hypothetical protein HNQ96_005155 [Aminobacter lissarensis]|uniref:Uncharacterized protein n=1 Tax=Aminobacter carboxidus TaxID=376165 RepID=A0A8E2BE15_9HYPH|nr:hypothetical protein [Aminobacter lissarensis]MBB6469266.1 hypothetical protein [Aminobacter lissarensis]
MFIVMAIIATVASAIASGLGYFSYWWVLLPAFLAGALSLANGPGYGLVIDANRRGRLGVFPWLLAVNTVPWLLVAGAVFWVVAALT